MPRNHYRSLAQDSLPLGTERHLEGYMHRWTRKITAIFVAALLTLAFGEALLAEPYIPDQLKPWRQWVEESDRESACALLVNEKQCLWPATLKLELNDKGGSFEYGISLDTALDVILPGSDEVALRSASLLGGGVLPLYWSESGRPQTHLGVGSYDIRGTFVWDKLPASLPVPQGIALVSLVLNGKVVAGPRLDQEGLLWLRDDSGAQVAESDSLSLEVFRLLADGVPFKISTYLSLKVTGKAREIQLKQIVLPNTKPVNIESALPFEFDKDDSLSLQVRAGEFVVRVDSMMAAPPEELSLPSAALEQWPREEIWFWRPAESIRSVQLLGGTPVEPSQTDAPAELKAFGAYKISSEDKLKFEVIRRGQTEAAQNALNLTRSIWLDISGVGATVRDEIRGTLGQGWRLDAKDGLELGRVSQNGEDQLITLNDNTKARGVEVRNQNLNLVGYSKLANWKGAHSAVGWDLKADSLRINLALPPGWIFLSASGADVTPGAWFSSWTLLDFFLLLLVSLAVGKMLGRKSGALAFLALGLLHHEAGAPFNIWFHLLGAFAIYNYAPHDGLKRYARLYLVFALAALLVMAAAFAISELRAGISPQAGDWYPSINGALMGIVIEIAESNIFGFMLIVVVTIFLVRVLLNLIRAEYWKAIKVAFQGGLLTFLLIAGMSAFEFSSGPNYYGTMASETMGSGGMPQSAGESLRGDVGARGEQDYQEDLALNQVTKDKVSKLRRNQAAPVPKFARQESKVFKPDPQSTIQTGPGEPTWRWREYQILWNGPVDATQEFKLCLLGPTWNLVLCVLRVFLLFMLIMNFMRAFKIKISEEFRYIFPGVVTVIFALLIPAQQGFAQEFPSDQMLTNLKARLEQDRCKEDCSDISSASFEVSSSELLTTLKVSSRGVAGVALPFAPEQLNLASVTLDNLPTKALKRDGEGVIWVKVPDGVHEIKTKALISGRNSINLQFSQVPLAVSVSAPGWIVDGLNPTGSVGDSLGFSRVEKINAEVSMGDSKQQVTVLPNWYVVTHKIDLGIDWEMHSTLSRIGSSEGAEIVRVPLIEGENVLSSEVKVENGHALVQLGRGEETKEWESAISKVPKLELTAPDTAFMSFSYNLSCWPILRCQASGLSPSSSISGGVQSYSWDPYPGEKIEVAISRPEEAPGESYTVDNVSYQIVPGARTTQATLTASVRASRNATLKVTLPKQAKLAKVIVAGKDESGRFSGTELSIGLLSGQNSFSVVFDLLEGVSFMQRTPTVQIGEKVYNINYSIDLPASRWLLLTGGKGLGPTVLFWSKLAAILIFAFLLSRFGGTPLSILHWVLLGLGLATLPLGEIILPVLWFLVLAKRESFKDLNPAIFNLLQVIIVVLTLLSFGVFYDAIKTGLIFAPDMYVVGNGSYGLALKWYLDSAQGALPEAWALSVPLYAWHGIMILWSLWLASALLGWLKWGFGAFGAGGFWKGGLIK